MSCFGGLGVFSERPSQGEQHPGGEQKPHANTCGSSSRYIVNTRGRKSIISGKVFGTCLGGFGRDFERF